MTLLLHAFTMGGDHLTTMGGDVVAYAKMGGDTDSNSQFVYIFKFSLTPPQFSKRVLTAMGPCFL